MAGKNPVQGQQAVCHERAPTRRVHPQTCSSKQPVAPAAKAAKNIIPVVIRFCMRNIQLLSEEAINCLTNLGEQRQVLGRPRLPPSAAEGQLTAK